MQGNNYIHRRKERGRERMEKEMEQRKHRTSKPGAGGDTVETTLLIVLADGKLRPRDRKELS